jgi:hypothetical protein
MMELDHFLHDCLSPYAIHSFPVLELETDDGDERQDDGSPLHGCAAAYKPLADALTKRINPPARTPQDRKRR